MKYSTSDKTRRFKEMEKKRIQEEEKIDEWIRQTADDQEQELQQHNHGSEQKKNKQQAQQGQGPGKAARPSSGLTDEKPAMLMTSTNKVAAYRHVKSSAERLEVSRATDEILSFSITGETSNWRMRLRKGMSTREGKVQANEKQAEKLMREEMLQGRRCRV